MKVIQLSRYRCSDTIDALNALVAKARAGEVVGVAICFRGQDGTEDAAITGAYASSTDLGAAAALRLSMRLANAKGEYGAPP